MTNIIVDDHVARSLQTFADGLGLTVGDYLAQVVQQAPSTSSLTADDVISLIEAEAGPGNSSYRGSFTRAEIYED